MEVGDLVVRPPEIEVSQQFRAQQICDALFVQLEVGARHGLMCIIDKFGEAPSVDVRGFRIHKIPTGKRIAVVRPCVVPEIAWERAFPLANKNLTSRETARLALETVSVQDAVEWLSTYTVEELLHAKGLERARCKLALETGLMIHEAFVLLQAAVDRVYSVGGDPTVLMLSRKLEGMKGEIIAKTKVGL